MSADRIPPANDLEKAKSSDARPVNRHGGRRQGAGRKKGPDKMKPWREAITRAAMRRDPVSGLRYLEMAAQRLVMQAVAGDAPSLREMGDRLDGKANANASEGQARVSFVVHMPAQLAPEQWQRMSNPPLEAMPRDDMGDVHGVGEMTRRLGAGADPGASADGDGPSYTVLDDGTGGSDRGHDDQDA